MTRSWNGHVAQGSRDYDDADVARVRAVFPRGRADATTTRFWSKVRVVDSGCWEWTSTRNADDYGLFRHGSQTDGTRRISRAHRYAYEQLVGRIPDGLVIDHLCRNTICVNPSHLEPTTDRINILRGTSLSAQKARQTHCKRGHPFDEANTYRYLTNGGRRCRACDASIHRLIRARQRANRRRRYASEHLRREQGVLAL